MPDDSDPTAHFDSLPAIMFAALVALTLAMGLALG